MGKNCRFGVCSIVVCALLLFNVLLVNAQQKVILSTAKFHTGDDPQWMTPKFNDALWKTIKAGKNWEEQGSPAYDGYAWYRFHFKLPSSIMTGSYWKDNLRVNLAKIDDVDEAYLNGVKIGGMGSFPSDAGGYKTQWNKIREYIIPAKGDMVKWHQDNVLAVKVYDGGGPGGIFDGQPFISMVDIIDMISVDIKTSGSHAEISTKSISDKKIIGTTLVIIKDADTDIPLDSIYKSLKLTKETPVSFEIGLPSGHIELSATFKELHTGDTKTKSVVPPYILTPLPAPTPRINNAAVFGIHPGSPFLFKIAATGEKPLHYSVEGLPKGLHVDQETGIITGSLQTAGDFRIYITVTNTHGIAKKQLLIRCGKTIALTPPMGWNSWNCWGLSVSSDKVKSSAQALIDKGLIDHGWTYMNIDDGWEAEKRNNDSTIPANNKFPSMRSLGDWLHSNGLKFGIYSSPGPRTCGGYLGSWKNERSDAKTYADWGIDYLKYDWCSYSEIAGNDNSLARYKMPYFVMRDALKKQNRDIVFSLCQYGMGDVWKWGKEVGGNSWRTTGDITDTWKSLYRIGFNQDKMSPYASPGGWNDPDMLIVGQVGWGENLHPTRLTADEQYTHISLWCLLSSPLLIGCDISKLDDFTLNLLTNDEVIAVNQDVMGKQARCVKKTSSYQIWVKTLSDGSNAVGVFNVGEKSERISVLPLELKISGKRIRDLWRQRNLGMFSSKFITLVPSHGVSLFRIR